jgi:hypothetical protein
VSVSCRVKGVTAKEMDVGLSKDQGAWLVMDLCEDHGASFRSEVLITPQPQHVLP